MKMAGTSWNDTSQDGHILSKGNNNYQEAPVRTIFDANSLNIQQLIKWIHLNRRCLFSYLLFANIIYVILIPPCLSVSLFHFTSLYVFSSLCDILSLYCFYTLYIVFNKLFLLYICKFSIFVHFYIYPFDPFPYCVYWFLLNLSLSIPLLHIVSQIHLTLFHIVSILYCKTQIFRNNFPSQWVPTF